MTGQSIRYGAVICMVKSEKGLGLSYDDGDGRVFLPLPAATGEEKRKGMMSGISPLVRIDRRSVHNQARE